MPKCNTTRSLSVGFMTALIMGLVILLWFGLDAIKIFNMTRMDIVLLFLMLWVVGATMDYVDQCYTLCNNIQSSIKYGVIVVTVIYLLFALVISPIDINFNNFIVYLLNVVVITALHHFTCSLTHRE